MKEDHWEGTFTPDKEGTYVEGFSQTQYLLMKFSGMTGDAG